MANFKISASVLSVLGFVLSGDDELSRDRCVI